MSVGQGRQLLTENPDSLPPCHGGVSRSLDYKQSASSPRMEHRIPAPGRTVKVMVVWTFVGALLAFVLQTGCEAAQAPVNHVACTIELQSRCHETNQKLTETTGMFHSTGNNTVMCGYFIDTLKCVAGHVPLCSDWFYETSSYYFQTPYDCKLSRDQLLEIQQIKNGHTKTNPPSENGGDYTDAMTSQSGDGVTSAPSGGHNPGDGDESESHVTGDSQSNWSNQAGTDGESPGVTESVPGSGHDKGGEYTVANANSHGDNSKHTGDGDSASCLSLSTLLLMGALFGSKIISKCLAL